MVWDVTPPPAVVEFAQTNHIVIIEKDIMKSEPIISNPYKGYNEIYWGTRTKPKDDVYGTYILVKIQDNKLKEIRVATPKEKEELKNMPIPDLKEFYPKWEKYFDSNMNYSFEG